MVWHGDDPSKKEADLNNKQGAVSVYEGRAIPTGRKRRRVKGYAGFGDLDPRNTRLYLLLQGELEVTQLDDDELSYGVPKCDDGKFSIRAAYDAATMPPAIKTKIQKELLERANGRLRGNLLNVIDRLTDIATSPASDDKDAIKAGTYILERVMGKNPEIVVHTQDKPFEAVIQNIARGSREASRRARLEANPPLEAEIVEDENG